MKKVFHISGMQKEILLSYFLKISHKKYKDLLQVFSSLDNAWSATAVQLKQTGWPDEFINEFVEWRKNLDEEQIQKTLDKEGIRCITIHDDEYPPLLKQIYDPPFCLFVRGKLDQPKPWLGVVGPRKISPYGKQVVDLIIPRLAEAGITIVSGLALGVDGFAHHATIKAKGNTVAVLAGGVDKNSVAPNIHQKLGEAIIESGGAVISEYPPFTAPQNYSFPKRNRIIAGMCMGTLVIEASQDSGSLITAQCALDANREVFAVPQNITSLTSVGTNNLLKIGAHLVTNAQDVLDILGIVTATIETKKIVGDNPEETKILEILSQEPVHIDDIIKNSKLENRVVSSTLTLMEIQGKVKNIGGMMYILGT